MISRLLLVLALLWPALAAGQARYSPDEVKAAFLFNFAAFVEWPAAAKVQEGLVIGVLNAEEVEAELRRTVAARGARDRPVTVRRLESIEEAAGVHILYVGLRESPRLARLLPPLRQSPVLVVTDAVDGLDRGSIINFVVNERVQFEVSMENAARAGLRLSPRLLNVALRVRKP